MGWAYSLDLRERVVGAFDAADMTDEQVAEVFQVGEATVHRWKRLKRETGSLGADDARAWFTHCGYGGRGGSLPVGPSGNGARPSPRGLFER